MRRAIERSAFDGLARPYPCAFDSSGNLAHVVPEQCRGTGRIASGLVGCLGLIYILELQLGRRTGIQAGQRTREFLEFYAFAVDLRLGDFLRAAEIERRKVQENHRFDALAVSGEFDRTR